MKTYRILAYTMHLAITAIRDGKTIDEVKLVTLDGHTRAIRDQYPVEASQAALAVKEDIQESPPLDPWEEIEVELTQRGELLRVFNMPLSEQIEERSSAIRDLVRNTIEDWPAEAENVIAQFRRWMMEGSVVRVIGAGRALLAASLPANRLHHGGAVVSLTGDKAPLPNSALGGGIIAASASGLTEAVLVDMRRAKTINSARLMKTQAPLVVIGISKAHRGAEEFKSLCTSGYYLGMRIDPPYLETLQLRGLGDIEEYAISELLDALVVRAGMQLGVNFRVGHEDFGATGPWHQHRPQH